MNKVGTEQSVLKDELYSQYNWFYNSFAPAMQNSSDEFFSKFFSFRLMSLSKNINVLFQGDEYFVTKIRIDKQHDIFFRCSSGAVKIILDRVLGENKNFNLSGITELEAKIISSFNDYTYGAVSNVLLDPPPVSQKRKNFDTIHLTFFLKDDLSDESGKLIISLPSVLLAPDAINLQNEKFDVSDFNLSKIDVGIKIGTTKFLLKELKTLEKEDIVIFEDSDIHFAKLLYKGVEKEFKITPNPGIITSINDDNGGHIMSENSLSQDLWDNIQVDMSAEFEKVKVTLGELKNIEQGLVVDISSIYDNKISLKVENKIIAKGELVIVNDRYGVRIEEVYASDKTGADNVTEQPQEVAVQEPDAVQNADEEFDYSDFELEDQDI